MIERTAAREADPSADGLWQGRVLVVSPHLDDAVLSLGASIRAAARAGAHIDVLTVLAGDPESAAEADESNRRAGFRTAGEAARERRVEDERACRLLGARPLWLPFSDDRAEAPDESSLSDELKRRVAGYDAVLVPGHPLGHADHRLVARLTLSVLESGHVVGFYVEQPYASWRALSRSSRNLFAPPQPTFTELGVRLTWPGSWQRLRCRPSDWVVKQRASGAYKSQIAVLRRGPRTRIFAYELLQGGESVCWCVLR